MWRFRSAQRRPESELRRHGRGASAGNAFPWNAQRRPESELRRHACCRGPARSLPGTLNEGRSLNSGDTPPAVASFATVSAAQRRPESELRRHLHARPGGASGAFAQRRPESELRRHARRSSSGAATASLNEGRSLNSGDTRRIFRTHLLISGAQRRPESELRRHAPAGTIEADTETAQRRPESELRRHLQPVACRRHGGQALNEGRSLNSGDTRGS